MRLGEEKQGRTGCEGTCLGRFPRAQLAESVFPEQDEEFFDFVAVGNCINFAFTNFETGKSFTTEYRGSQWRGAFGMWACLQRALRMSAITSGAFLSALTLSKCQELFAGDPPMPMIEERCAILKEVGDVLCHHYQGRFQNLLALSRGNAFGSQGLVTQLLKRFPSFRDESRHIRNPEPSSNFKSALNYCDDVPGARQ